MRFNANRGKIGQVLQTIHIIPLLTFGVVTLLVCYQGFLHTMRGEIRQELQYVARDVNTILDAAYPGDYALQGEDAFRLYKGDTDITAAYDLIDRVKADSDLEITLFFQDTRILTTIRNSDGLRIVGTGAPDIVVTEVLLGGGDKFYNKVLINGSYYFSYYMPVQNSDGTTVGMIFVGKPTGAVDAAVRKSLYPLMIATIITMALISFFLFCYTRKLVGVLHSIRSFLADVASGNLMAELDPAVTGRGDELGDIGRSAMSMQRSLRSLVEQDALTDLFNRRSADRKLKQVIQRHESQHTPFCLAIGDIDFFKKVNDTYGHDCGDLVLKNVAAKLREHMRTNGFAARWGGEEFLLVFDHMGTVQAHEVLERLLEDIRAMECPFEEHIIKITMTFGLTGGETTDITQLLHLADENLYRGKAGGRNRIVWEEPAEEESSFY